MVFWCVPKKQFHTKKHIASSWGWALPRPDAVVAEEDSLVCELGLVWRLQFGFVFLKGSLRDPLGRDGLGSRAGAFEKKPGRREPELITGFGHV